MRARRVDRVVVSLSDARGKLNMDELLAMKLKQGVRFDHLASVYEDYTGKIAVENLRPSWMIFSDGFRKTHLARIRQAALRRGVLAHGTARRAAAHGAGGTRHPRQLERSRPVLADAGRPQRRAVHDLQVPFDAVDAEATSGAVWSVENDPRVTRLGRFLRRTRLDELPQLWNVLRGDMSFIGPRPERPEFVANLEREIPYYGQRHVVRPGITGWAQVRHGYGATVEDAQEKLQFDLFYIKHMSFPFDVYIVLETVKTVLVRAGS